MLGIHLLTLCQALIECLIMTRMPNAHATKEMNKYPPALFLKNSNDDLLPWYLWGFVHQCLHYRGPSASCILLLLRGVEVCLLSRNSGECRIHWGKYNINNFSQHFKKRKLRRRKTNKHIISNTIPVSWRSSILAGGCGSTWIPAYPSN